MLTTFSNQALLKPSDVTLTVYKQTSAPSYLDQALGQIGKVLSTLPPNKLGLVTAQVQANSEKIVGTDGSPLAYLDPLDTMQLNFNSQTVLLADTWDAAGAGEDANGNAVNTSNPRTVRNVIQPLVPTTWLGSSFDSLSSRVINLLGDIPIIDSVFTPGFNQFKLGRTAPDVVPTDKLVNYAPPR